VPTVVAAMAKFFMVETSLVSALQCPSHALPRCR
jgi:hypothetical protein